MHLPPLLLTLLFTSITHAITISYDPGYSSGSRSLSTVACSDSTNGLLTKGCTTQSSLPSFPRIGGAAVIAGYNSANCGTCWNLTFAGTGKTINVLAIDHADEGFNIAQEAMDELTGGQAVQLGRVNAEYVQVDKSICGF